MDPRSFHNILVLGAGPAGLCAAWNLIRDGHRVMILEKEEVCGGQSITFEVGEYRYDLGPHNIHARRKSILEFLKRNLGDSFIEHEVLPQIYFRRKRVDYPLVGIQVLQSLPLFTSLACGLSFLWNRFCSFVIPAFKDDGTYETWIINRFGRLFYDIFFSPYSEKVWGIPPSELSDIVAKKRIMVKGLIDLIHAMLFKKETYHPENPRLIKKFYPSNGVGEIIDFFEKGILDGGGQILNGCKVTRVITAGGRIAHVMMSKGESSETLSLDKDGDQNWEILSTIPLNELILMMEGDVPTHVAEAARGLDFTSTVFLYLNLNKPDIFQTPLLYFSEKEFPFNRIYDIGLFSRKMVPLGKNAICLELSCSYGDAMWYLDDHALFQKCIVPLERHGLLSRSSVESYHSRRLHHAYPRFRVGYKDKLRSIFEFINNISNLTTFGREGLFTYANVDEVLWMGFEVAKNVRYQDRLRLSLEELMSDHIDV